METFAFQELRRQASWYDDSLRFFHYRDKDKYEVDVVMELGSLVAGVEVKLGATVTSSDFRGLNACGKRFVAGVVIYDGETTSFMHAVPIRLLWED